MDEFVSAETEALVPLLVAFAAAADEGHVTRAAELLGVPQSSLTRRIQAAERALGVRLFQPVGRGVALTPQGRELAARTRGLVRAIDRAVTAVRHDADPAHGLVRFGFPLTLGPVSTPSLLADFHRSAPGIRLHLVQAHGSALADLVRDGRLDLAVMIPPPDDLPTVELGRQQILLAVARSHRLAGQRRVELAELAGEVFVGNPPSYHLRGLLDIWCAEAGFVPQVAFEITEFDTVRALVARGLGIALLPAAETPQPDLVEIPLAGRRERRIGLVTGHHEPPPAVARLHRHIVEHAGILGSR